MIQTIGLEFHRGLLDAIDNCLRRSKLERLKRDLFEDRIAIIEDRVTVFTLSRRAYCHTNITINVLHKQKYFTLFLFYSKYFKH